MDSGLHGRCVWALAVLPYGVRQAFDGAALYREGLWTSEAAMAVPRSSCGAAVLHNKLFCVGGNGPNGQVHSSVEIFDPIAGRWLPAAGIAHARSSMALGVL